MPVENKLNQSLEKANSKKSVSIVESRWYTASDANKPEKVESVLVTQIKESLKRKYKSVDNLFSFTKTPGKFLAKFKFCSALFKGLLILLFIQIIYNINVFEFNQSLGFPMDYFFYSFFL